MLQLSTIEKGNSKEGGGDAQRQATRPIKWKKDERNKCWQACHTRQTAYKNEEC